MMDRFKEAWSGGPQAAATDPFSRVRRVLFLQDAEDNACMVGLGFFDDRAAFDHFVRSSIEEDRRYLMDRLVAETEERFFWITEY